MRRLVTLWRGLRHERGGVAAIDFAFAAPVLLLLVIGILQVGIAFQTNAGIRNAVESSARYASIYVPGSTSGPTEAEIFAKLRANAFGLGALDNTTQSTTISGCPRWTGTVAGTTNTYTVTVCKTAPGVTPAYTDVTMVYPVVLNLVLYSGRINLTYSRRAYRQ